jgi:hypothetical protein
MAIPEKKKMSTGKKILIGLGIIILLAAIANMGKDDGKETKVAGLTSKKNDSHQKPEITVGQALKTEYFEVTVNKVETSERISSGNEYIADTKADEGSRFLILHTTFKNIDNESRMITDGEVLINYNGKDYKFDKSETIMQDGYGLFLDQINPLTSKTTKLVYRIPDEIKGNAYYHPGRSDDDHVILLGAIN